MRRLLGIILILLGATGVRAAHTQATLLLSENAAKPGSVVTAAVRLKMDPKWHTYWRNSGDSGKPTKIEWELPAGFTAGEIQWPAPEKHQLDDIYTYVYHNEVALLVPITIAADAPAGPKTLKAKVSWLECEIACIPGKADVAANLTIGPQPEGSPNAAEIETWRKKIPQPLSSVEMTARWDGPGTAEERALIFATKKPGAWDFYSYRLENADVSGKTERLADADGQTLFRKAVKKWEGEWSKELTGLLVDKENILGEVTLKIEEGDFTTNATLAAAATSIPSAKDNRSLLVILGAAFLGGLILNIMPCVLPVIALKILGFVRQSNDDPGRIRKLGLIYGLGVLVSFMALAAFVISVKSSAGSASWGMQMQNPKFVIGMIVLVTLIALNLFGVFEINLPGMGAAGQLASREGGAGAFFNGALATLLATPCTAPFLAPALGFAFTQKAPVIIATFAAVAIGMASPYVILSFFPAWLKKLPKPGPWMEKFKHAMGFPMAATAIWLSTVTLAQFGRHVALPLGLFLASLAFAVWIYGEFVQRGSARRPASGGLAVIIAIGAAIYFLPQIKKPDETWKAWSPAAVQAARAQGRPVLVDFTAEWCLTCKLNKKVIHSSSVWEKIRSLNTATLIADNTGEAPEIVAELNRYQRSGVPLVLIFPADPQAPAIVLPEILTPGVVLDALDRAGKGALLTSQK